MNKKLALTGLGIVAGCALLISGLTIFSNPDNGFLANIVSSLGLSKDSNNKKDHTKGEILVKFKTGVSTEEEDKFLSRQGFKTKKQIKSIKTKVISVPEGAEEQLAEALSNNPMIEFAEVNNIVQLTYVPNDPNYGQQWHHPNISSHLAWDIASTTPVTIAIADTGIDPNHPDLRTSLVPGYNTASNNTDTTDIHGHGTMVAGVAAATGNNGIQVAGVAYNARIMPIRVTNSTAGSASYSDLAEAITYAADNGAKVVNLSFSGICSGDSLTMKNAANYMYSKGGLVVSATANLSGRNPYPDNTSIICVAATDQSDNRVSWSNYGPNTDVAAPGMGIVTTGRGGGMTSSSGTSLSAPLTAGALALIWGARPELKNAQVEEILEQTATDRGSVGWDELYGWGRINVGAAVKAAKDYVITNPSDTIKPTATIVTPLNNATVAGVVTVSVSAMDLVGVTKVELYKNGTLLGTDISAPYSFSWNTLSESNNSVHVFESRAYDAAGNIGISQTISLKVYNQPDTVAPVISSLLPADGTVLKRKGNITISTTVTDNVGVAQIEISLDGKLQTSCYNKTTCSVGLSLGKISSGTHVIQVRALDTAGNIVTKSHTVRK